MRLCPEIRGAVVFVACAAFAAAAFAAAAFAQRGAAGFVRAFGNFDHPHSVAFDPAGDLYIADTGGNRVVKYDLAGDSLACVTGSGWGNTQFDSPRAVAVLGIDVYVADYGNHRIQRFDKYLNFVATLYTRDNPDENKRFGYPRGVAVSRQGDLFILDGENLRIVKVNAFNAIERVFGGNDAGAERLADPSSIVTDASDGIYVHDGDAVKRFDAFGNPTGTLAGVFPLPIRGIAAWGDTLFVLSDSMITTLAFGGAEQIRRVIHLPIRRAWSGIAVSSRAVALLDERRAYIFQR